MPMIFAPALIWLCIALCVACSSNLESTTPTDVGRCGINNECPSESRCMEGTCISDTPPDRSFIVRISPPQQVPAAAVDLESVEFENTSSIDLGSISLTPIAQFTGTARLADGTSIPVRISARTLTDDMPPMVFRGETISDANGARFALRMPDGWPSQSGSLRTVIYSLVLYPLQSDRYPPWRVPSFRLPQRVPASASTYRVLNSWAKFPVRFESAVTIQHPWWAVDYLPWIAKTGL